MGRLLARARCQRLPGVRPGRQLSAIRRASRTTATRKEIMPSRNTYKPSFHHSIPLQKLRMNLGCGIEFARKLWTPGVAGGRAAKAPWREHHGLTGVGRGLQNGLDAADQLDRRSY